MNLGYYYRKGYLLSLMLCFSIGCQSQNNIPQKEDSVETVKLNKYGFNWDTAADSCTYSLTEEFLNKKKGIFRSEPNDISSNYSYLYWQQAHAIDVLIYSYERIKDKNRELASEYINLFEAWYENRANNYYKSASDNTGFLNPYTDDMCWISLSLVHMAKATGKNQYMQMAKDIYDKHIITRIWSDENGTGLPWKTDSKGRNACTNAPGCLLAIKLYENYKEEKYLSDAITLFKYVKDNLLKSDWRVEEPPLTYTQGTFAEACRLLYYISGDKSYMNKAEKIIEYTITSDRCTNKGLLRSEGNSVDQSIFKAVFVPYAVNLVLDADASVYIKEKTRTFLEKNADALWKNIDKSNYPAMFCNFYWGEKLPSSVTPSMGAQVSGASLMESVARMNVNMSGK